MCYKIESASGTELGPPVWLVVMSALNYIVAETIPILGIIFSENKLVKILH